MPNSYYIATAVQQKEAHAAIKQTPPMGVMIPSLVTPVNAIK